MKRRDAGRMALPDAQRLAGSLETVIQDQDLLIALLPAQFNAFMEGLFASQVELIPESHAAIKRAARYGDLLGLSRGDAIVLATVIEHALGHGTDTRSFLSGNTNDFGTNKPAYLELQGAWIKVFSRTKDFFGWLSAMPESS
jgi:hypothetical protein